MRGFLMGIHRHPSNIIYIYIMLSGKERHDEKKKWNSALNSARFKFQTSSSFRRPLKRASDIGIMKRASRLIPQLSRVSHRSIQISPLVETDLSFSPAFAPSPLPSSDQLVRFVELHMLDPAPCPLVDPSLPTIVYQPLNPTKPFLLPSTRQR